MDEQDKWEYINELDEELLQGGVMLSEWTTFLAKDAETAFCAGANLSCILACQAAIESHLRFDYSYAKTSKSLGFYQLIENSPISSGLKSELHELRKFRNKWVHINDPHDDKDLIEKPEYHEDELEVVAKKSIRTMLKSLYDNPMI